MCTVSDNNCSLLVGRKRFSTIFEDFILFTAHKLHEDPDLWLSSEMKKSLLELFGVNINFVQISFSLFLF